MMKAPIPGHQLEQPSRETMQASQLLRELGELLSRAGLGSRVEDQEVRRG